MMIEKLKHSQRYVISSSHVDKHGTVITKEGLESALKFINGNRKPRLGIEHNNSIPPLGRVNNGQVIQGEDGEYYLVADYECFDSIESLGLWNGKELFMESFEEENYPFTECDFKPNKEIEISFDSSNFESLQSEKDFIKILEDDSEIEFKSTELIRKSEIPDPEVIFKLPEIISYAIIGLVSRIPEKIFDTIINDLTTKSHKLISKTIKKSITELKPANRQINFFVELSVDKSLVELVVTTRNAEVAINAYRKESIKDLKQEVEDLIKDFNAEKIQYILNSENKWELNYLLTKEGKVIGTKKSFKKRNDFFQEFTKKQMERNKK